MTGEDYRSAGVDIDAGEALVEAIKPLAKATARPGCDAGLGGFAALFDLKAAGFRDPILLATTDGVGTKLKIAIAANRHDTIGQRPRRHVRQRSRRAGRRAAVLSRLLRHRPSSMSSRRG